MTYIDLEWNKIFSLNISSLFPIEEGLKDVETQTSQIPISFTGLDVRCSNDTSSTVVRNFCSDIQETYLA